MCMVGPPPCMDSEKDFCLTDVDDPFTGTWCPDLGIFQNEEEQTAGETASANTVLLVLGTSLGLLGCCLCLCCTLFGGYSVYQHLVMKAASGSSQAPVSQMTMDAGGNPTHQLSVNLDTRESDITKLQKKIAALEAAQGTAANGDVEAGTK